jgi:hypothetical protein
MVFSAKCSKGQKVVFVQKVIVFGRIRRHNAVFVVKSAGVTQRSIPKWVDERTSRKFHSMALGILQGREALHEFREGGVSVLAGKFDVETGVEKEQPVTVVDGVANPPIPSISHTGNLFESKRSPSRHCWEDSSFYDRIQATRQ